jgi:TetR/AcrR family transcriptional regulator, transcriptional repressor for nem operon
MEKKDTRQEIITAGMQLIATQGFNGTGLDAVLKRAGVPKGSFYYYFGNKEDFGLAVIDSFAQRYENRLTAALEDSTLSPLNRIRRHFEKALERFEQENCSKGCLIGNLSQEMADLNERFRHRLEEVFSGWQKRFARCLEEARDQGELAAELDTDAAAEFLLSGWEGALLRAKVMKSPRPLRDFVAILFDRILKP